MTKWERGNTEVSRLNVGRPEDSNPRGYVETGSPVRSFNEGGFGFRGGYKFAIIYELKKV